MNVNPVNVKTSNTSFGHSNPWADSPYKRGEQVFVAGTTALGVLGSMALLAKGEGYSLIPKKIFKNLSTKKLLENLKPKQIYKNYKKTWFHNTDFCDEKPVITIGAGSCLGGLIGGFAIDKDKENRKAKLREAFLQIVNISLPIIFTIQAAKLGKQAGKKFFEKGTTETLRTKISQAVGGIAGLFAGVFSANIIANKINEKVFKQGKGRPVQASDFSAHLDDFIVAAEKINENSVTRFASRLIPFALMIAGNEVGNTSTANVDS